MAAIEVLCGGVGLGLCWLLKGWIWGPHVGMEGAQGLVLLPLICIFIVSLGVAAILLLKGSLKLLLLLGLSAFSGKQY